MQYYKIIEFKKSMMILNRTEFFFRITKAMKHSEALSNSATTGTAETCNRKAVLRIQSKFP